MKDELIIINKTAIQKRIEELENKKGIDTFEDNCIFAEKQTLKQLLSQSTPLIPEIEKAFDLGFSTPESYYKEDKQDYISNLKLDI